MPNPFIQTDIKQALELLAKIRQRTSDLTVPMRMIAGTMLDSVEENFKQEGRPRWPSLAAATIAGRKKRGTWPGKMLQVSSGGLASSVQSQSDATSASVGTNKVYAAIHQFGGKVGRNKAVTIRARPFLWLGEEELKEIEEFLIKRLTSD